MSRSLIWFDLFPPTGLDRDARKPASSFWWAHDQRHDGWVLFLKQTKLHCEVLTGKIYIFHYLYFFFFLQKVVSSNQALGSAECGRNKKCVRRLKWKWGKLTREACNVAGTPRGNWAASFLSLEGATRAESVKAARWISPALFSWLHCIKWKISASKSNYH